MELNGNGPSADEKLFEKAEAEAGVSAGLECDLTERKSNTKAAENEVHRQTTDGGRTDMRVGAPPWAMVRNGSQLGSADRPATPSNKGDGVLRAFGTTTVSKRFCGGPEHKGLCLTSTS